MNNEDLQKKLKHKVSYDPGTGVFRYNHDNKLSRTHKGDIAGYDVHGRKYMVFNGEKHAVGTIVILYMDGYIPKYSGFHDKDPSNMKYDNVFASETRCVYKSKKKKKALSSEKINVNIVSRERLMLILDCLDGGAQDIECLTKKSGLEDKCVNNCLKRLISGGQVEICFDRAEVGGFASYRLTNKGHCRIFTEKDEAENKRLTLHVQLYRIFHKTMKDIESVCRATDRRDYIY